jgi:hypothetical protein
VQASRVTSIEPRKASLPPNPEPLDQPLPEVDQQVLQERLAKATYFANLESKKIGVGVTENAQRIFNALAKTYSPILLPVLYSWFVLV